MNTKDQEYKHMLQNHFTVTEFAKKANEGTGISTAAVYKAITDKRIIPVLVGEGKTYFISPKYLTIRFRANLKK